MEAYKWLFFLVLLSSFACTKKEIVDPEIRVTDVHVEWIKSDKVDINYKLSDLGYQETGVMYYKKSDPAKRTTIRAIRQESVFKLSMQGLAANTEYVFKVFFKQKDGLIEDTEEYTVKTLNEDETRYTLSMPDTVVNYDDLGNFSFYIEGEKLNNLNLLQLLITVDGEAAAFEYPVLLSAGDYKIPVKGIVPLINRVYGIAVKHQNKEIFFKRVAFAFAGERYWLNYKPTKLRNYFTSVFDNDLYYLVGEQVSKWNDAEERLTVLAKIPAGTVGAASTGIQFDGQLFYPPAPKSFLAKPTDLDFSSYPEAYSFRPKDSEWIIHPFKEQAYSQRSRLVKNSCYFVHDGEFYLSYTLEDDVFGQSTSKPFNVSRFLYRYNKSTGRFDIKIDFGGEILDYRFISVNKQLYVVGMIPVLDQGHYMSATLAVYKVDDNFQLEEVYRGGTIAKPLFMPPVALVEYEGKILIAGSLHDIFLFDPAEKQMSQLYQKIPIPSLYFGGFFYYGNKLHLGSSLGFIEGMIYEISVNKGR